MKLRSITARAAVAGAATALMAGGLVAATGTAANAVDDSTDYNCVVPVLGPNTFNLAISTPVIPATATAGQSFPGGLLALTATLTIPAPTGAMLASFGVDHADASDYGVEVGPTTIGAPIAFDAPVVNEDGSATVPGAAANAPFTLPPAGNYKAMLPSAFTLTTSIDLGQGPQEISIPCSTETPGNLGSIDVTKGGSTTVAKAAKKGKATVTVDRPFDDVTPAGTVTAKLGKKKYSADLNDKGVAKFNFGKKAKGKKVTFVYLGDEYTDGSKSAKTTLK